MAETLKQKANEVFAEYLKEDSDYPTTYGLPKVGPMDGVVSADDDTHSPHQVTSDPDTLNRVNAWLASLTMRPYINAYSVIQYLKQKLTITGLDFKEPKFNGEYGTESVPVLQWGNPTSLVMNFKWVRTHGWYTISAELEGKVTPAEPISEDEAKEGEEVSESSNPFSLINTRQNWRRQRIQRLFKRNQSSSRVASMGMRKALSSGATKAGHAIKAAFGSGGYTHTQGRKTHIHQKALRSKSFLSPNSIGKMKKMTNK